MTDSLPLVHETVVHMLADAARIAPDAEAVIFEDRRLTYAQYARCVGGLAAELAALGAAGQRVALICGNSLDLAVAMFAIHAAGAQAVPINPMYTARELRHILADAEPLLVIHDEGVGSVVLPLVTELAIPHAMVLGGDSGRRLDQWRDDPAARLPQTFPRRDDLATLQYTGGTTGLPKGVDITHGQMAVNISQREARLPTRMDDETILCVMPMFHVFAVSMGLHLACYCRGRLLILPRYHPDLVFDAIAGERVTRLPAGATLFIGLMGAERFGRADLSSLRTAWSGASALPGEILKRWRAETGCPILEGYGQSEAGPVLSFVGEDMEPVPGSVGTALVGTEIQIVDTGTGSEVLPTGEMGEIRARGPQIMRGYRNRPEETAVSLRGGWLYTGDIGELDDQGRLFIRDRKKDMVITGGYNVYPREVEEVLFAHPDVLEAAVVGMPDSYRGELLKAFVAPRPGRSISDEALRSHCEANLASYKIPAVFEITDALPKTAVGKIDKLALKTSRVRTH